MVRFAKRHKLDVQLILLTHAHPDHIADLPVSAKKPAQMFLPLRANQCLAPSPSTREKSFGLEIYKSIRA